MRASDDPRRHFPPGTKTETFQITDGTVPVYERPDPTSQMVTQALFGETVACARGNEGSNSMVWVQIKTDGYIGWLSTAALAAPGPAPTHRVNMLRTFAYSAPDLKSAPLKCLPLNAHLAAGKTQGRFIECAGAGWVTDRHLAAIEDFETDPAAVAERFIGAPYLWGGKDSVGLDCTGLSQTAFGACGITLPRDSDMQFAEVGEAIDDWLAPGALRRNDLIFWRGHMGIMTDPKTLIHANAYHMAVAKEPLMGAIERIETYYDRPIGARRLARFRP